MSFLSRMFGFGKKHDDPEAALEEPVDDDEELGLFDVDAPARPASVALRVEQLRARAPGAQPDAEDLPEDEAALADAIEEEIAEPPDLLPQRPEAGEPSEAAEAVLEELAPRAEGEARVADAETPHAEGEAPADAAEPAAEPETPAAPLEVKTVAAPKDEDALSMFRDTGANSELLALTKGIDDQKADDLLADAREINSWLRGEDAA